MTMIAVNKIDDVIKLAQERKGIYENDKSVDYNTRNAKLEPYLQNLTFDEVKSLQVIMYLGRDEDYNPTLSSQGIYDSQFEYFDKTLGWNTQELEINQIMEKLPLADYLLNGKKILGL